jgi:hypothetical protein
MPTILNTKGLKFIIFTDDHPPPHVHVKQAEGGAKIQLEPVEIIAYWSLTPRQLREIMEITRDNRDYFLSRWYELHG